MVFQWQMVIPRNTDISIIIQTEQVVFRNKYTYPIDTYMHVCNNSERGGHEGKGEWGAVLAGFGRRKRKGEKL